MEDQDPKRTTRSGDKNKRKAKNLKRAIRSGDKNSHRPFASAGSGVIEVGRDHHHLDDIIGETKPKKKKGARCS